MSDVMEMVDVGYGININHECVFKIYLQWIFCKKGTIQLPPGGTGYLGER